MQIVDDDEEWKMLSTTGNDVDTDSQSHPSDEIGWCFFPAATLDLFQFLLKCKRNSEVKNLITSIKVFLINKSLFERADQTAS